MKRLNRIISLALLALICGAGVSSAQSPFKWKAALPRVDSNGYYRINLPAPLVAKSKAGLGDLRITGPDEAYVSYIKIGDLPANVQAKFTVFPQVKINAETDTVTVFVMSNMTGTPVSKLWVKLKNTEVQRHIAIAGSDDMQHWFAIRDDTYLMPATDADATGAYEQVFTFPASNYRYLKLVVDNHHKSPVNILRAGIYNYLPVQPRFVNAGPIAFTQKDSAQVTHLHIKFNDAYAVDKLHIGTGTSGYFKRKVNVYLNDSTRTWVSEQYITNDDTNINLSVKSTGLDVEIINNDDRALAIKTIAAYQQERFVVARLDSDKEYYLITGNARAEPPHYDLQFFTDKIAAKVLPAINAQQIDINPHYKIAAAAKPAKSFTWLIWAAIGIAVVFLSVLTMKMAREIGKG